MGHAVAVGAPTAALLSLLAGASTAGATAPIEDDSARLMSLLELEVLAQAVYAAAEHAPDLPPAAHRLANALRSQEQSHASSLAAEIGAVPPPIPHQAGAIEAALAKLGITVRLAALHGERAWFTLLDDLEKVLEAAYYTALGDLTTVSAATLAAQILANEAQHATVLFRFRHPRDITLAVFEGLITGPAAGQ